MANLISDEDFKNTARLSRLEFSSEEEKEIKANLEEIVNYFGEIKAVDTNGINFVNKPVIETREDVVQPSLDKSEVVKNAPFHNSNAFIVPRVVE